MVQLTPEDRRGTPTIDLNQATHEELARVVGIGDARADDIIRHRRERGGFRSVDELDALPQFAGAKEEELRDIKRRLRV